MADDHLPDVVQSKISENEPRSPFDRIRHTDESGDYWLARELMPLLEYSAWQDFENAIRRAIEDCAKSGRSVKEHFEVFRRSPKNSQAGGRPQKDYRLTRYACYLVVMASRTEGSVAARARTYFTDKVEVAEAIASADNTTAIASAESIDNTGSAESTDGADDTARAGGADGSPIVDSIDPTEAMLNSPEFAFHIWRMRAINGFIAEGYSPEWATRRVDDIVARNALTHEWSVRGIKKREYAILTNQLHMGAFGLSIEEHKGVKDFPVTYNGRKLVYKGDLPPAMTMTELALNALSSTVSRELHIKNDSHGFKAISRDVEVAGRIVGDTRRQIEAAIGQPVVSSRNMLREPDGGIWAGLPSADDGDEDA